jgi:hypothetical protein
MVQQTLRDQDDVQNRVRYLRMLSDCEELVVFNYNGMIGPSVTAEIALALAWGKKVSYVFDYKIPPDCLCLHTYFSVQPRLFNTGQVIVD